MNDRIELTIRSSHSADRTVPLIDDACQICHRTGLVTHLATEDWRLCVDCLTRHLPWQIASHPVPTVAYDLADASTPNLFATIEQHAGLTPVERTIIRQAVADHAPTFYGGVFCFGEDDAARYTAETYVHTQINNIREQDGRPKLRVTESIDLTAAEVTRQRHILGTPVTAETYKARLAQRVGLATQLVHAARDAWRDGDNDRAAALIDLAEATSPVVQVGLGYDHFRSLITADRPTSQP